MCRLYTCMHVFTKNVYVNICTFYTCTMFVLAGNMFPAAVFRTITLLHSHAYMYAHSISQVISLSMHLEASQSLPLELEKVVEVNHRFWTVKPVAKKTLKYSAASTSVRSVTTTLAANDIKYICRPSHSQLPHTGAG